MNQYASLLELVVNEFEHWPATVGFMGHCADGRLHMNAGNPQTWGRLICHSRDSYPGYYEGEVTRSQWEAARAKTTGIVEHAVVLIRSDNSTVTTVYTNPQEAVSAYMQYIADGKKVVLEARHKGDAGIDFNKVIK